MSEIVHPNTPLYSPRPLVRLKVRRLLLTPYIFRLKMIKKSLNQLKDMKVSKCEVTNSMPLRYIVCYHFHLSCTSCYVISVSITFTGSALLQNLGFCKWLKIATSVLIYVRMQYELKTIFCALWFIFRESFRKNQYLMCSDNTLTLCLFM